MSQSYYDPSFYISIISTVSLIVSEILPFLPIKSNGILHTVLTLIASPVKAKLEKEKHDNIDENNSLLTTQISELKKELKEIKIEMNHHKNKELKEIKIEMNHNYNHKHKDNAKPEKKPTI
jgi:hypothetical protein